MRALALVVALLMGGCESTYGAVDPAALSEEALIARAREAVARARIPVEGQTAKVLDRDRIWVVVFEKPNPVNVLDVVGAAVVIDKKTGEVEGIADPDEPSPTASPRSSTLRSPSAEGPVDDA